MNSKQQRAKAVKKLGIFFIEQGKIHTKNEYNQLTSQPVIGSSIRRIFGGYAQMVNEIKKDEALVALIEQASAVHSKKDPLETLRASKVEK